MTPTPYGHSDFGHHVRREGRTGFFSRFGRRRRGPTGPRWKRTLSWIAIIGISGFFAATVSVIGLFAWVAKDLPDPNNITQRQIAQTTKIYDRTGQHVLYEVHGDQKRTLVELSDISDYVKHATIAAEDKDFYKHSGFDLRGILRALYHDVFDRSNSGRLQGGSTITQQFIKKSILTDEQTITRKVKELVLSVEIEKKFTKDQILKLYLNEIPYGSVAYGIESASQTFFGKSARDLTLSEASLLASLPRGPTYYSPFGNHRDALIARQHYVLDAMVEEGYVTKEQADDAKKDDVLARIKPNREAILAPHFVFYVKDLLAEQFGEDMVEGGGLKVITTLDLDKQQFAEQSIADHRKDFQQWKANTAALAAIDPRGGDILAMVGSADYFDDSINGQYNSITGSRGLQPGSSIKPFVYATAFAKGYTPSTVVYDVATTFKNGTTDYVPSDYDGKERGPVTLKEALAGSLNIPAVQVMYLTGIDRFLDIAKKLGYDFDPKYVGLSLVLGTNLVRPLDHIDAYTTFANEGMWRPTKAILKVEDKDGKIIFDGGDPTPAKRVFDIEIARQVVDVLTDNNARAYIFGQNNPLTLPDRPVGAKTGTTNEWKDGWTIGFTPSLVAGVWVGDARGAKMKKGADGSIVAGPIWNEFMRKALAGTPVETFTPPQPVTTGKPILDGDKNAQITLKVDKVSGKLATDLTPPEDVEERHYGVPHSILFFVDKDDPRGPVPDHPENDPQFANWEQAVATWATTQHIVADTNMPTATDDVHVPENAPSVSFADPMDGGTIAQRDFHPTVVASARRGVARVEYSMDGQLIGTAYFSPYSALVHVPNRYSKGFHTLTAKAYDDAGNAGAASITVNLTADPGPLGVQWIAPWSEEELTTPSFPFSIKFTLDDPSSISSLRVMAVNPSTATTVLIGSIENPALPNISMQWHDPPSPGRYDLTIDATLTSGDDRKESIPLFVR